MYFYYSICGLDIRIYVVYFQRAPKKRRFSLLPGPKNDICRSSEKLSVNNGLCACIPITEIFVMILNDGWFFHTEWNLWLGSLVLHSAEDPLSTSSPTWPLTCPNDSTMLTTCALIKFIFWWIDSGWLSGNLICVIVMLVFFIPLSSL